MAWKTASQLHYTGGMSAQPVPESSADRIVEALHGVDRAVDTMRERRINDPESFGDKIFKTVVPSLAGLAFGKLFEMAWNKGFSKAHNPGKPVKHVVKHSGMRRGATHGIGFAIASAAFGALVAQLSERGSQALVDRRHRHHH